jgi:hypothetical protein
MRKLFLCLFFICLAISSFSQNFDEPMNDTISVASISTDTLYVYKTYGISMPFNAQLTWDNLVGSVDSEMALYESNNGIDYVLVNSIITILNTSGSETLTIQWTGAKYVGVRFIPNSVTAGNLYLSVNRNQNGR